MTDTADTMCRSCTTFILTGLLAVAGVTYGGTVTDYPAVFEYGYQYLDPRPESEYVAPETRLLIRFEKNAPKDLLNLEATGLITGLSI